MFSVDPSRIYLLIYLLAGAVSATSVNLPRQQDPGSQVWQQTTVVPTSTIDPNTGQPYTTPVTGEISSTGTSTSTASSPTGSIGVEPLDGEHTGDGTFFTPGLGACGMNNTDADPIAAVSYLLFDYFPGSTTSNPNTKPYLREETHSPLHGPTNPTKNHYRVDNLSSTAARIASFAGASTSLRAHSARLPIGGETLLVPNTAAAAAAAKREISRNPREEGHAPKSDPFGFKEVETAAMSKEHRYPLQTFHRLVSLLVV
ncbi:hypothetical protein IW261DRAFT_1568159 [Armillaria novae-zelandiae]|uniref:Uncharacterized protein n=1 Tax=Armillaria novae-zelandiae TaxID=153914 RepID=A0AA39UAH1_9AGAR|nr:hypothetical protein IW261DRAFT_1568159 [Armillaria novae-zelandiae]